MAAVSVRDLDETVRERLRVRAAQHGRSMEAEIRAILTEAVRRPHIGLALMQAAHEIDDLPVPERTDVARAVDFG